VTQAVGKPSVRSCVVALGAAFASIVVSSCGLRTPQLEFGGEKTERLGITINHIVNEVRCELIHGVVRALAMDDDLAEHQPIKTAPKLGWLEDWSALATITMTAEDISSLSPGVLYTSPFGNDIIKFPSGTVTSGQSFSLGANYSISADGTRTGKVNFFFVFKDYIAKTPRDGNTILTKPCEHQGDVLLESNLRLDDWIQEAVFPAYNATIRTPEGYTRPISVISHEVSFVIKQTGNITPSWKLIPVSANQGSLPFFQAQRNRTDDLLITLGATAATDAGRKVPLAPSNEVLYSHLASEIGASVSAAMRSPGP
jgi:hypothetical protein